MNPDTGKAVLDALRRGFAGTPCDVTCQPCAIEQARIALELAESCTTDE